MVANPSLDDLLVGSAYSGHVIFGVHFVPLFVVIVFPPAGVLHTGQVLMRLTLFLFLNSLRTFGLCTSLVHCCLFFFVVGSWTVYSLPSQVVKLALKKEARQTKTAKVTQHTEATPEVIHVMEHPANKHTKKIRVHTRRIDTRCLSFKCCYLLITSWKYYMFNNPCLSLKC